MMAKIKLGGKRDDQPEENIIQKSRRLAAESQGTEKFVEEEPISLPADSPLSKLRIIPIERIRPGRYQTRMREENDPEDELRQQIAADLETHETLEHVFIVSIDPDDSSFYNLKRGGHRRLTFASEFGAKQVWIWIDEYNQEDMARGTYFENNGRKNLTTVEEGEFFLRVQEDKEWTQTEIAQRFKVAGGQPHVARAMKAASYPNDIKQMLFQDPDRGERAAEKLAQLEALGPEEAKKLRAPLITAFLSKDPKEKLSTDGIQIAVDYLLNGTPSDAVEKPEKLEVQVVKRVGYARSASKTFDRYIRELGDERPSQLDRLELEQLQKHLQEILSR